MRRFLPLLLCLALSIFTVARAMKPAQVFTPEADARIQDLMDRNDEGELTPSEHQELASLASLSEQMSLVRAKALVFLGRQAV